MKKVILLLAAILSLLAVFACTAPAEEARDITAECRVSVQRNNGTKQNGYDRKQQTVLVCDAQRVHNMTVTVGETPLAGVYVEFGKNHFRMDVQQQDKRGEWVTVASAQGTGAQIYAQFPPVTGKVRLRFEHPERSKKLTISELYLFSEGEKPESVHIWQPTVEKADLMLVVAHPDDELIWFSGMLPTYAGEMQKSTVVSYLTCSDSWRELELLNGLWHCGVRTYPVVGSFRDYRVFNANSVLSEWGRRNTYVYLVQQIRKYKPEVLVTHGLDGEYGHGQHKACAVALVEAVKKAADATYDARSAAEYGTWQVKKLYLHQNETATTVLDWRRPLNAFGGKTGFDVACEAYAMHISQMDAGSFYEVAAEGTEHDSFRYELVYSAVGPDVLGNDLFENIPE